MAIEASVYAGLDKPVPKHSPSVWHSWAGMLPGIPVLSFSVPKARCHGVFALLPHPRWILELVKVFWECEMA